MKVRDIMSTKVQTIDMNEKAESAWNLMKWRRIHHVVVTDGPARSSASSRPATSAAATGRTRARSAPWPR